MPNKCGVFGCKANYSGQEEKVPMCKLPKDPTERKRWLEALPPREEFNMDKETFYICFKHWPEHAEMKTVAGGSQRPIDPPSIFVGVPASCVPTAKPKPRGTNQADRQLEHFLGKDRVVDFDSFKPEKALTKACPIDLTLFLKRDDHVLKILWMNEDSTKIVLGTIPFPYSTQPDTIPFFENHHHSGRVR